MKKIVTSYFDSIEAKRGTEEALVVAGFVIALLMSFSGLFFLVAASNLVKRIAPPKPESFASFTVGMLSMIAGGVAVFVIAFWANRALLSLRKDRGLIRPKGWATVQPGPEQGAAK